MLETSGRCCKHLRKLWKFLTIVIKYVFLKQGKSHENSEKIVCSQCLGNSKTKFLATPVGGSTGSIGQRSNFRVAASILTQPHNLSTRLMRFIRQQYYCHTQYSYIFRYIVVAITCIQSISQSTVYWIIGCSKKNIICTNISRTGRVPVPLIASPNLPIPFGKATEVRSSQKHHRLQIGPANESQKTSGINIQKSKKQKRKKKEKIHAFLCIYMYIFFLIQFVACLMTCKKKQNDDL